ncbi:MAG: helix-turn-helix domain-containing protein [Negativicutes bacterium]|nr:helix-turn-helix domain-containing protein [Negativicutes bacterium]
MENTVKKVYEVTEVQQVLGLSRNTVMALLLSGKLKSVRAGRRWLIPAWALDSYLGEPSQGA